MTQKQMLALVRKLINDEQATGFTEGGNLEEPEGTQELLNYLDRAVDEYSNKQAAKLDLRLIKTMKFLDKMPVPDDFIAFCGKIPASVEDKRVILYVNIEDMPVKYFARLPYVSGFSEDEEMPYENDQYITIAALGAIYALNKHEYNVSQHLALLGMGVNPNAGEQLS